MIESMRNTIHSHKNNTMPGPTPGSSSHNCNLINMKQRSQTVDYKIAEWLSIS